MAKSPSPSSPPSKPSGGGRTQASERAKIDAEIAKVNKEIKDSGYEGGSGDSDDYVSAEYINN